MKKVIGMLVVVAFASSMASAELLKNFKANGSVEISALKANNADYNKKLSDTYNQTRTRVMVGGNFDLNDDVNAQVTAVKNNRKYGTNPGERAITQAMDNFFFEEAYMTLKGVFGLDHKVGRQYYGNAGDINIYFGPLGLPYDNVMTVNALDGYSGWWKSEKWNAHALVAKQICLTGATDTNIFGLVGGYNMNEFANINAYFYQRAKQAVGLADDTLDVAGAKVNGKFVGIEYTGEFAQNMGKNDSVATGFATAGPKAKYKGSAMKVNVNYNLENAAILVGKASFMGEYAMGTGDKAAADNNVKAFMSINSDYRPGFVFGGYNGLTTGLQNLTTWNVGATFTPEKLNKLTAAAKYYHFGYTEKVAANDKIGNEMDFSATWKHSDNVSVMASFGSFDPDKKLAGANHDAETRMGADFIVKF